MTALAPPGPDQQVRLSLSAILLAGCITSAPAHPVGAGEPSAADG